ncbi:MAG TPA: TlpA disulfide reductase family protein [Bacteroidales bacterium]|nr:TlpA disulfide reductase family protein [Bacteroidales bacterium]
MNRIYFIALIALMGLAACSTTEKKSSFKLTLGVDNFEGKQVKVQKRVDDSWVGVDSVKVEAGVAHLTGAVSEPEMMFVVFEGMRGSIPFFAEPAEITIKAAINKLEDSEINGSVAHERYAAFMDKFQTYDEQMYQHYKSYSAAEEAANEEAKLAAEAAYEQTEKDKKQFLVDYLRTNNKDLVSHYILFSNSYQFELEELESLVINFDPAISSSYLTELHKRVQVLKRVVVGMPYVDFEMKDVNDSLVKLSDKIGSKLLLVDFWASWCSPCRAENPNIVAIYKDFHSKGFDVFGVSLDNNREKWLQAIADDKLSWTHVSDLKRWGNAAGKLYGVQSIPHSLLLDANGVIIAKDLRGEELRNKVAEVLK